MSQNKPQVNRLTKNMSEYVFEPAQGKHFSNKILALRHGRRLFLIDTGYEGEAQEFLTLMRRRRLSVEGIVISHFHADHMSGLQVMPNVAVFGSAQYQITLNMLYSGQAEYTPSITFEQALSVDFGKHKLKLLPHPGHSHCTVLTIINDRYIHIGDELMFATDGRPLLPLVEKAGIRRQLDALQRLKRYADYTMIPAHGPVFGGRRKVLREIENRIIYLEAVLNSKGEISFSEAVKGCDCQFLHSEWHSGRD